MEIDLTEAIEAAEAAMVVGFVWRVRIEVEGP